MVFDCRKRCFTIHILSLLSLFCIWWITKPCFFGYGHTKPLSPEICALWGQYSNVGHRSVCSARNGAQGRTFLCFVGSLKRCCTCLCFVGSTEPCWHVPGLGGSTEPCRTCLCFAGK